MIALHLTELSTHGESSEALLEASGPIPEVLQALDTWLLSNEQHGRAFDVTIEVYDETVRTPLGNRVVVGP